MTTFLFIAAVLNLLVIAAVAVALLMVVRRRMRLLAEQPAVVRLMSSHAPLGDDDDEDDYAIAEQLGQEAMALVAMLADKTPALSVEQRIDICRNWLDENGVVAVQVRVTPAVGEFSMRVH